jgi:hypothetical protein
MAFTGDHIPETQSLTPSCPSTVISVAVRTGNKLLLARSLGEHLRLSQGQCPTSLDDTPSRENALSRRGREQVNFELGREHAGPRREAERSVTSSGVRDGRESARVHEAVLLRYR